MASFRTLTNFLTVNKTHCAIDSNDRLNAYQTKTEENPNTKRDYE